MPDAAADEQPVEPYTALAAGYDLVMSHVDYAEWAGYVHQVIQRHHPDADRIVELGCGTGTLALELQPRGDYDYLATDKSRMMLRVARYKAREQGIPIRFEQRDFTALAGSLEADVVILVYDGLNYLRRRNELVALFEGVQPLVRPGGLFIVDQSTPSNSVRNSDGFDDSGHKDDFSYWRTSTYDPQSRLHTTTFVFEINGRRFREEHVQRAYEIDEVRSVTQQTRWAEIGLYDDCTFERATTDSTRVHWVLKLRSDHERNIQ